VSQNFVTIEELDKRLAGHEKLGTSQTVCGELEDAIRKNVRVSIENSHVDLTKIIEDQSELLFNKIDSHVKKYMDNLIAQIQIENAKTISSEIIKAKRDIDHDLNLAIKAKIEEPISQISFLQKNFEITIEKIFFSKLDIFESHLKNEMKKFEKEWLEKSALTTSNAVEEIKDSVAKQSHSFISNHASSISKIIEDLKTDLSFEMSKKLVDKQAIEQRIREIEEELNKKAQNLIDFNISQARHNMEQSARAELKESINSAAGKIISGLT
jgi:polyhydroxyalkanoate synthesis regulator phasin